ncbi:MAG: UvrD-helicase domain-containing protein [Bacteroidales bacterium]|nr:UvrD-helicase domain-containing protein [Bacteroidales bacterium]
MQPKRYDPFQQEAIAISGGTHLVLAPPGCGKTDILAERIVRAHDQGVAYDQMLCLTFTNRAAKGMAERIGQRTQNPVPQQLFVGNVHRYCSQLLFENGVVPKGTAIVDEIDFVNIINECMLHEPNIKAKPMEIYKLQHAMHQLALEHPEEVVLHNYMLREPAVKKLCTVAGLPYSLLSVAYVYQHIEQLSAEVTDSYTARFAQRLRVARAYEQYKDENDIIDFDDILILAYDYATNHPDTLRRYGWIQVDEVQDLNALQFAIIDLLTNPGPDTTVVFLGDEQQAIYSFIGAKIETLQKLRQCCGNNLHYLYHNYRSPNYLLAMLNDYATTQLGIRPELLPTTSDTTPRAPEDLCLLNVGDATLQPYYIARFARRYADIGTGRVAILVATNKAADAVAEMLESQHLDIFKISGVDFFSTHQLRLLLAHLTVTADESVFIAWARLLHLLGVVTSYPKARNLMRQLKRLALSPVDLIEGNADPSATYVARCVRTFENETFVVFDTETTGLDIHNDDIIQIAAIKVRHGRVVPGSEFNIVIETSRSIPTEVGGAPNPMLDLYARSRRVGRAEGLRRFAAYCEGHTLVGHNVEYDYQILRNNLGRSCPDIDLDALCPTRFDTLKLIRLLQPRLKRYKLGYLVEKLHLEGVNSHRADDDIMATLNLLNYCHREATDRIPRQELYLAEPAVKRIASQLASTYLPYRQHTLQAILHEPSGDKPALIAELDHTYRSMVKQGLILPVPKWQHFTDYLEQELIDTTLYPTLDLQLQRYITDLNTAKEADLCGSSLKERFFVSTVHKAKGLEFETVIVADAIDGIYPFARDAANPQTTEDARRLYVAMSRAKRRLCVVYSDHLGETPNRLSPFLTEVMNHFHHYRREPLTGRIVTAV